MTTEVLLDPGAIAPSPADRDLAASVVGTVGLIYRAAAEPELWESACDAIGRLLSCHTTILLARGHRLWDLQFLVLSGITPEEWATYAARYAAIDPFLPMMERTAQGETACSHNEPDFERLEQSVCFREFYLGRGIRWSMLGMVERNEVMVGALGLHRRVEAPPFDDADEARVRLLLPHLSYALRLQETLGRLSQGTASWRALIETLDLPILLVAPDLTLLDANDAGRHALDGSGPLRRAGEQVAVAGDAAATQALRSRLQEDLVVETFEIGGKDASATRLRLLRPKDAAERAATLIVLGDVAPADLPAKLASFGLTPAETRVASLLCRGMAPAAIADELAVSVETIRTQMKNIKTKTGTSRQAELVQALLTGKRP